MLFEGEGASPARPPGAANRWPKSGSRRVSLTRSDLGHGEGEAHSREAYWRCEPLAEEQEQASLTNPERPWSWRRRGASVE